MESALKADDPVEWLPVMDLRPRRRPSLARRAFVFPEGRIGFVPCSRCRNDGHNYVTCRTLLVATSAELSVYPADVTPERLAEDGLRPRGTPDACSACGEAAHRGACRPPRRVRVREAARSRPTRARRSKPRKVEEPEDWRVRFWRLESRRG